MHRVTNVDLDALTGDCEECGPGVGIRIQHRKTRPGKTERRCRNATRRRLDGKTPSYKREAHGLNGPESHAYKAGKVCEICGSDKRLVVDHCHRELRLRGVLCHNCNTGIGMLGDDVERLQVAIAYLERSRTTSPRGSSPITRRTAMPFPMLEAPIQNEVDEDDHECRCPVMAMPPCIHCTSCAVCEAERALDDGADAYFESARD